MVSLVLLIEAYQVEPTLETFRLRPDATYLMVGCLGGIGRSLTTWMMERGAKHFSFISRSGVEKPEAAQVVEAIRRAGASTNVFRADASDQEDVSKVVKKLAEERPIRGVVHAAMVLKVCRSTLPWVPDVVLTLSAGWPLRENVSGRFPGRSHTQSQGCPELGQSASRHRSGLFRHDEFHFCNTWQPWSVQL